MTNSAKYEMVKRWYEHGKPIKRIRDAVEKGFITAEEFEKITGEKYE